MLCRHLEDFICPHLHGPAFLHLAFERGHGKRGLKGVTHNQGISLGLIKKQHDHSDFPSKGDVAINYFPMEEGSWGLLSMKLRIECNESKQDAEENESMSDPYTFFTDTIYPLHVNI